jgi:hypothetical protein
MIPLRDVNPTARFAWVTLVLILLNVAVFLLWEPVGSDAGAQPEVLLGWWFVFQLLHGVGGLGIDVNGGVAYWAPRGRLSLRPRGGVAPPGNRPLRRGGGLVGR